MSGYWGLRAIADRMGWKYDRTPVRQLKSIGFPIYRCKRNGRTMWFSEESLIVLYQLQRVKLDREQLLQKASPENKAIDASSRGKG